jgi:hypothetical protein
MPPAIVASVSLSPPSDTALRIRLIRRDTSVVADDGGLIALDAAADRE